MIFEHSINVSAEPSVVFSTYENVSAWSEWDPETESSSIEGDFVVGAMGKIKPKGAPESKMQLIEVTRDQSFTVECKLPLCKMHFIHLMHPDGSGTKLVNRVEFSGLLSPIFGRLVGKGIDKSLPGSLKGIQEHIEK